MTTRASDFTIELGPGLRLSARKLWVENLLITANSGGGKSVAGRQLIEQALPHCAMVVFDYKGEFWSLRDAFDVILVGRKGELPIDVAIAPELARFVREQGCRVVVDLSGVDEDTKQAFVAAFVAALLGLPDRLWRVPMLVYVSEAQMFAPEEGRPVSRKAIRDLATLGRQQRICTVLDTQRIAEVAKAALGSVNNRMFGRLNSDVDLARATGALGLSGKNAKAAALQMKRFEPGWFFCEGPAFDPDGTTNADGDLAPARTNPKTRTRHIDPAEDFDLVPPPPSASVTKLLGALTSRAAQAKADTDAKPEAAAEPGAGLRKMWSREEKAAKQEDYDLGFAAGRDAGRREASDELRAAAERVLRGYHDSICKGLEQTVGVVNETFTRRLDELVGLSPSEPAPTLPRSAPARRARVTTSAPKTALVGDGDGAPERVLMVLLAHPGRVSRARVAIMAHVSVQKSTLRNALTKLKGRGDIVTIGDELEATAKARREHPNVPPLPTGAELVEFWRGELGEGAPRQLFETFVRERSWMTHSYLAEKSGVRNDKSTMRNALTKLRGLGLITKGRTPQLHPELVDALEKVPRRKGRVA